MLRKWIYPYKNVNIWGRFNETLPDKKIFYISLNMGEITNGDHKDAKRIWKENINKIPRQVSWFVYSEWHHYHLQMYLKVFAKSFLKYMSLIRLTFSVPGLAWQAC